MSTRMHVYIDWLVLNGNFSSI